MKHTVQMTEMKECQAVRVSLVKHGANQTGIRIAKSEKESGMFDLSKLGKAFKSAADEVVNSATELLGVIVMKGSEKNHAAVIEALKSHGVKIDTVKELEGGAVMFAQKDFDDKEAGIVGLRVNGSMIAIVKGFSPYSEGMWQNDDFDKKLKVEGLYQDVYTACNAFQSTLGSLLQKADSPTTAKAAAEKLVAKFGKYIANTIGGLPEEAFKMAEAVALAEKTVAKAEAEEKELAEKAAKEAAAKEPPKAGAAPVTTEAPAAVVKTETPDIAKLVADSVAKAMEGVMGAVTKVAEGQSALATQVKEVAAKSEKLETTLKSTVTAAPGGGDTAGDDPDEDNVDPEDQVMVGDTAYRTRKTHSTLYKQ